MVCLDSISAIPVADRIQHIVHNFFRRGILLRNELIYARDTIPAHAPAPQTAVAFQGKAMPCGGGRHNHIFHEANWLLFVFIRAKVPEVIHPYSPKSILFVNHKRNPLPG